MLPPFLSLSKAMVQMHRSVDLLPEKRVPTATAADSRQRQSVTLRSGAQSSPFSMLNGFPHSSHKSRSIKGILATSY